MKTVVRGLFFVVIWFLVFLLLLPWLVYLAEQSAQIQRIEQRVKTLDEQIRHVVGGTIGGVGLAVAFYCAVMLAIRGRGIPAPFDPPQRFVAGGLYKLCRNPMMFANVVALFGYAVYFGSWMLLLYALIFWLISHLFIILYEEPHLIGRFGDDYRTYMDKTPRWWPQFRKPRPSD